MENKKVLENRQKKILLEKLVRSVNLSTSEVFQLK